MSQLIDKNGLDSSEIHQKQVKTRPITFYKDIKKPHKISFAGFISS